MLTLGQNGGASVSEWWQSVKNFFSPSSKTNVDAVNAVNNGLTSMSSILKKLTPEQLETINEIISNGTVDIAELISKLQEFGLTYNEAVESSRKLINDGVCTKEPQLNKELRNLFKNADGKNKMYLEKEIERLIRTNGTTNYIFYDEGVNKDIEHMLNSISSVNNDKTFVVDPNKLEKFLKYNIHASTLDDVVCSYNDISNENGWIHMSQINKK